MKRHSTKTWAVALVLAITAADCVGIYVAQVRLHRAVPVTARETAYADATAVKQTWRATRPVPESQRVYANTATYAPPANVPAAPVAETPPTAPAPQRLAQAAIKVPAYKPRTDAYLTPPRLAEAAPVERVELATEVHTAQHRAALQRVSARVARLHSVPPTSLSFAAAFGASAGTDTLALPEPTFGKQGDAGDAQTDLARPSIATTEPQHIETGDSATIGKSSSTSSDAPDPELPAASPAIQAAAQPGS